jgi:hypothetical protein
MALDQDFLPIGHEEDEHFILKSKKHHVIGDKQVRYQLVVQLPEEVGLDK